LSYLLASEKEHEVAAIVQCLPATVFWKWHL